MGSSSRATCCDSQAHAAALAQPLHGPPGHLPSEPDYRTKARKRMSSKPELGTTVLYTTSEGVDVPAVVTAVVGDRACLKIMFPPHVNEDTIEPDQQIPVEGTQWGTVAYPYAYPAKPRHWRYR
ncbi:hypothetical protein ArV1_075 [Arthrobacter phage vB_ArtM-ArV1]|uniref:Uncharacterized protein n=1 Tax=Arthrobacter phage vB_ArtM-ArV1 TaxID=1566993 RepID=A0A0A7HAR0_9CAUD|nr:hypothetical protein ArV1_075 [Arthrobacter phage vB_ArtM-ArV1]AIZ01762.1 hypothetical protein ArV1_075 [Arthrobacter phage vB_ArtM-ArV1]